MTHERIDRMIVTALFSDYDSAESAAHSIREHIPGIICKTRCEGRDSIYNTSATEDELDSDWTVSDASVSDRAVFNWFLVQSALFSGDPIESHEPGSDGMFQPELIEPFDAPALVAAKGSKHDIDIAANILRGMGCQRVTIYGDRQ